MFVLFLGSSKVSTSCPKSNPIAINSGAFCCQTPVLSDQCITCTTGCVDYGNFNFNFSFTFIAYPSSFYGYNWVSATGKKAIRFDCVFFFFFFIFVVKISESESVVLCATISNLAINLNVMHKMNSTTGDNRCHRKF